MELNEYQRLAKRTINFELNHDQIRYHSLHGIVAEVGEIHELYQKVYQGHEFDEAHEKKELGDLMWFVAEYCTSKGWTLEDVCIDNIKKLQARYPDGFEDVRSLFRKEGDL